MATPISRVNKSQAVASNEAKMLVNSKRWAKNMQAIREGYKRKFGKEVPQHILETTAVCLDNTAKLIGKSKNEATGISNMGNFIDYGLGIITAVMPSLIANEIVSVQPLKARNGEIFYLQYNYGSNKSGAKVGDAMLSPFTGPAANESYTSERTTEALGKLTTSTTSLKANLSYLPLTPGSVEISIGDGIVVDDGKGALAVKPNTTFTEFKEGTINYDSGEINLELNTALGTETDVLAQYSFSYGNGGVCCASTIPEINVELGTLPVSTVARSLRARWMFDVDYEFDNVHGVNIEAELAAAMAAEVRHEIDMEIMNDLYMQASAGGTEFVWSKTPAQGVSYIDHKDTFVDTLIRMSNAIFGDTQRAQGNFIIAGLDVCSLLESLVGRFVPSADNGTVKAGPHICGVLNGRWKVIKNPYYSPDAFVMGAQGASHLESGYVYAPYLPLYTTETVMLDDFVKRKGVRTRYGKKMLNNRFYAKGKITD